MGILLGLLTALTWGGADFIARFATHRVGALRSMLYMQYSRVSFCSHVFFLRSAAWGISRMAPGGTRGLGVYWLGASMLRRVWRSTARLKLGKWRWLLRSQPVIRR